MSDFFMPTQNNEYWNKKQEEQKTQQAENAGQNNGGYWDKKAESYNQAKAQHYENWNRYGVEVPDEYYNVFNEIIGKAESPEQAQEEAYRIGSAVKYAKMYGMSLDEAYKNVDAFNEAQFTNLSGQKARYEALSDMFTLGTNNVKLGKLGNKLMIAQRDGDTELAEALMAEIGAIQEQNVLLQDNAPRSWVMQALEAGAQSLPFTGAVAGAGIIGNFIAPAVGTGAAFLASSYLSSGQEYIDSLANGATPETARTISMISGGIQGLIEADLGITASIVKNSAKIMGKEVAENAAKKAVEEIGQKFYKRFHFGAGKKLLLNYFTNYAKGIPGEVLEEGLQEITSVIGQEVAAAMDGYDIPDDDAKHIVKQIMEAAKGGLMGAISLGIFSSGLSTFVEVKDFKKMQKAAEVTESPEAFYNENKENPIFSGMAEPEAKAMSREIWERVQQRKDEAINEAAKEILETTDLGEGAEGREVNEQGEEEPVNAVARNEEGRLDIQDDETTNEDGTISGNFRAGDRTKEKNNRYGYINYTADEKNKTVEINNFVMGNGRESLRGELFDEFSRKYAGYKIEWNTIKPAAQAIKESLIENNPNGKKAGLSYYSDEDLSDIQTRKRVATELRQNIYSIEQVTDENGNVSYVKKELSNKQVAAGIALLESAAKRMGMSLTDYVNKTFSSRIFATEKEFEDAVAAQGDTTTGKAGAMEWKRFGQELKAVIYAGENADFSTWVHELAHVFQSQLTGDLKAQAEKAFNVIDGDWIGSKFTFADGHTDSAAEAFAYGFQDWLKTGRAENEELKNIFQKFAEFLARAFNALKKHIDFTPEIEEVYNQLLAGDDSIMAKAEKAVEEEDRAYRAKMKADEEAKQAAAKKEAEDAQKAEEAEREEKSEVTEYAEENADEVTEAEKKLDEVTNEESKENVSEVDNALKNLNLTDEKKTELSEVLKNPDETQQAKAGAIVDAASESAYGEDEDESFESLGDMLFQGMQTPAEITEAERQMDAVRKQYEGTDQWLKAPNGEPTNLTEKQWLQVRTPNFKRWFGNWEKAVQIDRLKNNVVTTIKKGVIKSDTNTKIIEAAKNWIKNNVTSPVLTAIGDVVLDERTIQNSMSHGFGAEKIDAIQAIPEILQHGEYLGKYADVNGATIDNHYFAGKVKIGDDEKIVFCRVKVAEGTEKRFYVHEVFSEEQINNGSLFKTGTAENGKKLGSEPLYLSILREFFDVNKNDYSKVIDENGEPLVVYHGTDADFNVFDASKSRANMDIQGNFFSPWDIDAKGYGSNVRAFYLNIRNPANSSQGYSSLNTFKGQNEAGIKARELLKSKGFDGVNNDDEEFITFEANQIKSATDNNGNFDVNNPNILFQTVTDKELLKKLNSEPTVKVYRAMQEIDGKLYPPMATVVKGKRVQDAKPGEWIRADENPNLAIPDIDKKTGKQKVDKKTGELKWKFNLDKGGKDASGKRLIDIPAAYNPYWHTSRSPLNDQFLSAYKRPNIVTVEVEIPESELTSGYKAERAKDAVGEVEWKSGVVSSKLAALGNPRRVILSRYCKVVRVIPNKEVASQIASMLKGTDIAIPDNTVTPSLLAELKKQGVKIEETEEVKKFNDELKKRNILFQTVYHGSGAQFDKFNTEEYALSGEGSMSFGYGTYLTDDEEIARDYAERQYLQKYGTDTRESQLNSEKENLARLEESLKDYESKDVYESKTEQLKKDLEVANTPWRKKVLTFALNKRSEEDRVSNLSETISEIEKSKKTIETLQKEIVDIKENSKNAKRHLYTVEIPDNGYFDWEKTVAKSKRISIMDKLYKKLIKEDYAGAESELRRELIPVFETPVNGKELYQNIWSYLGGDKETSQFLHSIGYAGIKYPAGTIHGNGNGAYNYVIFNDEDAKIIDHLLFQTQEELYKDARAFDSWQDFMEYYESWGKPENSLVPYDADAQWYQSTWEMAHGVKTEQEQNEEKAKAKHEKQSDIASAMDALFMTGIQTQPEMLDNFLKLVSRIDAIDLDGEEWQNIDESGAEARDWYERMKDFISFSLSDYNWQTAMRRVRSGNEIAEGLRKRLIGEMTDPLKVRDFRAIYAEVMEDEQYAVDPQDTVAARLSEKLNKYAKKYHDIVKPNEDIARVSPERRKQIAQEMANRDIAAKIANGSLKLDDELSNYIKNLTGQMNAKQKQLDELEKETKADYQRIADAERRKLLKLHEELLLARNRMTKRNSEIERKIAKGLKVTEKYQRETQNMGASYNELFRKYKDLENSIELTAEVKEAITRQERYVELKEDLNNQKKEKSLAEEVKKMRIQLVKRTMRRVPFNRIDKENAKTVIAIQRMLEPNLMGGVNRFIGVDSPFLRGVISQLLTDSDYKQKILNYLSKSQRSSQAFVNFKNKIENMKSIKEFDEWTRKEREYAIKHLPKENWVKELNLEELAKEREESIDLDISTEEKPQIVYDEKTGEPKQYRDADGQMHTVTVPVGRTVYSDEIGRRVQEAVGADMFDKIVNLPFAEWTTEDLEGLAKRIDELYTEGRELLAAKNEARKREAERLRKQVEDAIKETGITINDDDTPEEKEKKLKKIDKILGTSSDLKGTEAGKNKGLKARLNRLLHGYSDMNLLRFARMLDNQSEGINTYLLYRKEDECFNAKQRSITSRADTVRKVMQDNKITEADLAEVVKVGSLDTSFTVDELLFFLAADKDYEEDEKKLEKGLIGIDANDDFAATSRNAVMFGNMMSDNASQEQKEAWDQMNRDMAEAIENDTLTTEQKQLLAIGQLDKTPGTTAYINSCHAKWETVLGAANSFLNENPKFKALMEVIEADYAAQYERMNEVSINEFNTPVHRVKAYVPLVRKESNGEDNVNQVKEDLLGAYGAESGKQWVNKGMTQRRQNIAPLHQKPVQTGLFNTWASSIERTEHFIAYAPYVRQLNAIYKSRDAAYTRRFIEARYGKAAVEYLDNYINEVANPKAGKIREKGAEFLHTLRGRTAPAYLGWKLSGIIKQGLTSPWPYMQFVNPAEYAAACFECLNPEKKAYDAIKEKSVFMRTRSFDPIKDLIDEVSENAKSKLDRNWSKFTAMGMQGLEWIDWACVAPGWLACYKKKYNLLQKASEARYQAKVAELTEKNMAAEVATSEWLSPDQIKQKASQEVMDDIEMEAVTYADDCTRQCQPSSRLTDLAPLFKNSSEAMKAFLQFQTSLNVIWQNIRYDIPYAVRQKDFKRIAGGIIGYVMAGIFMNSVMDGLMGDDDEDKDLQALRNLIFYSTTQFTDAIPMIGSEITNTMDMLITGKRNFASSGTDMTPSATKILNALTKATKGDFKKAAALTAEGIGLGLGAPVSGTKEIYKLLGKPLKEGDVNLKRGVGDVYGLAGDILGE